MSTVREFARRQLQSARECFPTNIKTLQISAIAGVAYYLGAEAAFFIGTLSDRIFAPFWPPNIVLFCTLLLVPKRQWWLPIAAAFPAHALAEIAVGMPAGQLFVAFATNCVVAVLNAACVRWFLKEPPWFGTFRNVLIYILMTAGLCPATAAFGGAFVQILGGGPITNYWTYWGNWYMANALGSVTLGPAFLIWFNRGERVEKLTSRRKAEAMILTLCLVGACAIAFQASAATIATGFLPAVLYSPFPVILWAAIRFGQRGANGGILVVTLVSIWQNLHGSTVFIGIGPERNVLALQVFLMGISVPVFLLGGAIDELRSTGEAMRNLTGALLQAQDEERRRIARELHDSTGQNLVVARLMVSRVQSMAPASCDPVVAELNDVLQKSLMEIRTVSYLLHPPLLEANGLTLTLRSYLDGFSKRTGIGVGLELSPDIGRIASDVELVLFRVVQEALTNVWRHSGSATAKIRLAQESLGAGQQVKLTIEDSGKGMANNIRLSTVSGRKIQYYDTEGIGLASMRERLHQVGGHLEIDSVPGKTVIRAIVPLGGTSERSEALHDRAEIDQL